MDVWRSPRYEGGRDQRKNLEVEAVVLGVELGQGLSEGKNSFWVFCLVLLSDEFRAEILLTKLSFYTHFDPTRGVYDPTLTAAGSTEPF